ncbi:MAG: hypothetical protein R2752_06030 [Vicinamibacterales bacterium]
MKIEDPRSSITQPTSGPVNAESSRTQARKPVADGGTDEVRLSGDLQVVDVAVRAAALAGDVRPEAIANARALLDRGALDQDLDRLANRIIDSLLDAHDAHS